LQGCRCGRGALDLQDAVNGPFGIIFGRSAHDKWTTKALNSLMETAAPRRTRPLEMQLIRIISRASTAVPHRIVELSVPAERIGDVTNQISTIAGPAATSSARSGAN
jgi:hypothetical protein